MPAIATEEKVWDLGDGRSKRRKPGELLQEFHVGKPSSISSAATWG
jgi:hypothetical protein